MRIDGYLKLRRGALSACIKVCGQIKQSKKLTPASGAAEPGYVHPAFCTRTSLGVELFGAGGFDPIILSKKGLNIGSPVSFLGHGKYSFRVFRHPISIPMIAGELRRFLRDHSAVRVSRSMRDTAYKVLQVKEKLTTEDGREPDIDRIAKELDLPRQEVVFALEAMCDPVSLYEPIFSEAGESATVMDQIGDTRNTDEHWLEQIALEEAVHRLSKREKRILALRFYDGHTQMEVAKEVGISQAQVSRLEKNAISQIKKEIGV